MLFTYLVYTRLQALWRQIPSPVKRQSAVKQKIHLAMYNKRVPE